VSEDLTTPTGIESKLTSLVTELTNAQLALAAARNTEVRAKHAYEAEKRATLLGINCPKVTRGGFTTAERDAWVEEQVKVARWEYAVAEAKREAAQDHLRVVRDQAVVVMAIGSSVRTAYSVAGSGR
jgi:hypothetical protein